MEDRRSFISPVKTRSPELKAQLREIAATPKLLPFNVSKFRCSCLIAALRLDWMALKLAGRLHAIRKSTPSLVRHKSGSSRRTVAPRSLHSAASASSYQIFLPSLFFEVSLRASAGPDSALFKVAATVGEGSFSKAAKTSCASSASITGNQSPGRMSAYLPVC